MATFFTSRPLSSGARFSTCHYSPLFFSSAPSFSLPFVSRISAPSALNSQIKPPRPLICSLSPDSANGRSHTVTILPFGSSTHEDSRPKPAYRWGRVLLKVSGEALAGDHTENIDPKITMSIAKEVASVISLGIEIAIVVGGGNIFRGASWAGCSGLDRSSADHIGMLATVMNAIFLQATMESIGIPTRVQTAFRMSEVAEPYIRRRALRHLEKGRVVIFAAGTGNPFFTTDTAAALRGAESRKRRRRSMFLGCQKKRRRIVSFTPSKDPNQRLVQMGSLATALISLKVVFSNDLTYIPGMAPRSANMAIYEKGGMQVLAKEDKETLELCRTMYREGECPPLVVVLDTSEGFTVHADEDIKDMTFITEYTGDVDYLKIREHDDCDSMMTLLLATDPSHSLVICPDKRGNIARLISGINNHTPDGRKKQNLKCVRYDVDGACRVLLVACRDISRGERLYYDYNGYEQEYPTEHFF